MFGARPDRTQGKVRLAVVQAPEGQSEAVDRRSFPWCKMAVLWLALPIVSLAERFCSKYVFDEDSTLVWTVVGIAVAAVVLTLLASAVALLGRAMVLRFPNGEHR